MRPPNTFANDAVHPTFASLEGTVDQKLVDGRFMDREEYDTCGWRRDGEGYWMASLQGLREYSRRKAEERGERVAIARTVQERDDEFREYVDSLDDAKPSYG